MGGDSLMKYDTFEDDDDLLVISIRDDESGTYIDKRLPAGQTWHEILIHVVHMLNGVGYYIDSLKAEEAISELVEDNRK